MFTHYESEFYIHHKRDEKPTNADFPLHVHDFHELCYFISGNGRFFVESDNYDVYPGCVLIMRAGEAHRLQINTDLPYERIDIEFSPALLRGIDPDNQLTMAFTNRPAGQHNLYTPHMINAELVRNCMNTLSSQFDMIPDRQKRLTMISCFAPVLLEVNRAFQSESSSTASQSKKAVTTVNQLVEYINTHLCEELTLDTLSSKFFTSKAHLNHQFKQVTGHTIWEYIIIKRLVLARQYIRDGMSVGLAATSSGWKDYSSFYRSYRTHFGVSPISDRPNKTAKLNPAYDLGHTFKERG